VTGEDFFLSVYETMKELELSWTKLKGDRAQIMVGNRFD
jgi:hypothetical protein